MDCLFNGSAIFGNQTQQQGPFYSYAMQRHKLPGVSGFRIYDLAADNLVWQVTGLLWDISLSAIQTKIATGQSWQEGPPATFRDNAGNNFTNCLVVDFRPIGPYLHSLRVGVNGIQVQVLATIEQLSP